MSSYPMQERILKNVIFYKIGVPFKRSLLLVLEVHMWRMKTSEVHLLEVTASLCEAAAADLQDRTKTDCRIIGVFIWDETGNVRPRPLPAIRLMTGKHSLTMTRGSKPNSVRMNRPTLKMVWRASRCPPGLNAG